MGSAIGVLEECLRAQVKERHPKIRFYLGKAYRIMNRPLKVYEYWSMIRSEDHCITREKKIEVKNFLISMKEVKTL